MTSNLTLKDLTVNKYNNNITGITSITGITATCV